MASINKENEAKLTQEKLKQLLHYDSETGSFTWLTGGRGRNVDGTAGYIDKINGYCRVTISGTVHRVHRLAFLYMTGNWPKSQVDHINGVRVDNRWCNLREVTNKENNRNRRMGRANTSGVVGVYWNRDRGKWRAHIMADSKQVNLGDFSNKDEAIAARQAADIKYNFHENHGRAT